MSQVMSNCFARRPWQGGEVEGMVVVVPALAEGEEADPPVVPGMVPSGELLVPPDMGGRVDEPGDVPHPAHAQAAPPDEGGEPAQGEEQGQGAGDVPAVVLLHVL